MQQQRIDERDWSKLTLGERNKPSDTGYTDENKTVLYPGPPFHHPTDVSITPAGEIYVSDGYRNCRVHKYDAGGNLLMSWGEPGDGQGQFNLVHSVWEHKGRVYVADRQNNRIQVFDQDGTFITAWREFGQPSSVFVDARDNLYVGSTYQDPATRESPAGPNNRAIVIGDAITGDLRYLIPDPGDLATMTDTGTSASGIAVDAAGNIYAADVGFNNLRKYVRVK